MTLTLSLSIRVLVNAEALNMAESVGNYTRHRKAPIVLSTGDGYSVVYVPAVSGESLAHSYQQLLTQIAKTRNLPVTKMDELGYYLKFSSDVIVKTWYEADLAKIISKLSQTANVDAWLSKASLADIEKAFLKASVIADVTGFLYTDRQVKRTSAIRFSYMLPTIDAVEKGGVSVVPQLHTRYAPPEPKVERAQELFYVESGSALYTFTAELIASDISKLYYSSTQDPELEKQRVERVKAAVDALTALVDGMIFGAKRSRYSPLWDVRSIVVSLSRGPIEFVVSPGYTRSYIKKTYERAVALTRVVSEEAIGIYVYNGENLEEPTVTQKSSNVSYEKCTSHTEALSKARDELIKMLGTVK
jgi:CRISPR-associated protein Csa2